MIEQERMPAYVHCRMRARQRSGISVSEEDYLAWCSLCEAGRQGNRWTQNRECLAFSAQDPRGRGRELHRIKCHGASIYVVYDRPGGAVVTVYSTDDLTFSSGLSYYAWKDRKRRESRKEKMARYYDSVVES